MGISIDIKQIPTQSSQRKEYTLLHVYPNYPLAHHIAFLFHDVYARCPGRGSTEYNVHHYFATTYSAVVCNFIVCKSATSATRTFLWRHNVITFCFLKSIDWPMQQTFEMPKKKTDSCGQDDNNVITEKEESFVLLLTLKWNVFTITAYKVWFYSFSIHLATNRYHLSIGIDNRYQSITTWIFAINCSSIININRLIDIDWYRLISIVINYRFY